MPRMAQGCRAQVHIMFNTDLSNVNLRTDCKNWQHVVYLPTAIKVKGACNKCYKVCY